MPNDKKPQLFIAKPRTDPLDPVQIEKLKSLLETTCRVQFQFRQPLVVNAPPVTIEGLKEIRREELEDGSTLVEFEIPEGADPDDVRAFFAPFGNINPEHNFFKDYDDGL